MKIGISSRIFSIVLLACLATILPAQDRGDDEIMRDFLATRPNGRTRGEPGVPGNPKGPTPPAKRATIIGLAYTLYQKNANGEPVRVTAKQKFSSGDNLRFVIESNSTGYFYIFHQENDGAAKMLFPDARLDWGKNRIKAHAEREVPGSKQGGWFNFSGPDSTERFYLVVSRVPLRAVPTGNRLMANSQKPGAQAWRPSQATWEQILTQAKTPVRESKEHLLGQVQTKAGREPIGRNVEATLDAPQVAVMNKSPQAGMLVAVIEIAHVQSPPAPNLVLIPTIEKIMTTRRWLCALFPIKVPDIRGLSMTNKFQTLKDNLMTRREMLHRGGMGMGALALAQLVGQSAQAQEINSINPLAPKPPHFPGKVKRVVHLFMNGGPSHVDTFDPKPQLEKYDGKPLPIHLKTERQTGAGFASPFKFQKHGQSGIEVSELFPNVAKWVDELCVIRSMRTELPNHEPSLYLMNCGDQRQLRPSLGSWVTYGLGSENQNLPGFVVMTPGGHPTAGAQSWTSAFLPGVYQGTFIDPNETDVERLIQNIRNNSLGSTEQRAQLDLLAKLNRHYQRARQEEAFVEAQIQSYELAFRMQTEATDAFDISQEPESIRRQYGNHAYGRQLLIARRLLERGVRFVQCWQGKGQPWDSHDNLPRHHRYLARVTDQPIAALLNDLNQRGMLEDTLVIWGGEFGRTPTVELTGHTKKEEYGRDHNPYGFTVWMAGAGVRKGYVHGATDEFGFRAVENVVHVHDLHATILHLLGFDHERLTYRYAGRDFRLTDVHGLVVKELMA